MKAITEFAFLDTDRQRSKLICCSVFHRQLTALGITNHVVCPTRLDERYRGVPITNLRSPASGLSQATRLDRYLAGNDKALAIVRVPTEAEEQKRALKRQRQQLRQQRLSFAAQGRSLMLLHGHRESNHWWHPGLSAGRLLQSLVRVVKV